MEYLVSEGLNRARKDKRKTIFYKDLGNTTLSSRVLLFVHYSVSSLSLSCQ